MGPEVAAREREIHLISWCDVIPQGVRAAEHILISSARSDLDAVIAKTKSTNLLLAHTELLYTLLGL